MSFKRKRRMKELTFEEYVEIFYTLVERTEKVDKHTYRGRCPSCGDSKKIKSKKRFYLMREKGRKPCMVYCHNCGLAKTALHYFYKMRPEEIAKRTKSLTERDLSDIKELAENKEIIPNVFYNSVVIEEISPEAYVSLLQDEVDKAKKQMGKFFSMCTYPVVENPEAHAYLTNRNIPEESIKEMVLLSPDFHDSKKFRFAYFRDYVMVPFLDKTDGKPYYFHSRRYRKLNAKFAKFLACPYRPEEVEVDFFLNEMRVEKDNPVIIAEGTFDSLNLENSIAVNGVKKITHEQIKRFEYRFGGSDNIIYALDNENLDFDANKKARELLKCGKRVFLWSLMEKDSPVVSTIKDFNELCVKAKQHRIPTSSIEKYTSTNPATLL